MWQGPMNYRPKPGLPWSLLAPVPIQGPKARYRGAALWRVTAPSPSLSLPPIRNGLWVCGQTSPLGAYFMRPVCRAECDDPHQIPVDAGLEGVHDPELSWQMLASLARPWLSRWGGYPALR